MIKKDTSIFLYEPELTPAHSGRARSPAAMLRSVINFSTTV